MLYREGYHITVEELVKVSDKEVAFEIFRAYDREIIFESARSDSKDWEDVKGKIVSEFYPTDSNEIYIYICQDWMKDDQ